MQNKTPTFFCSSFLCFHLVDLNVASRPCGQLLESPQAVVVSAVDSYKLGIHHQFSSAPCRGEHELHQPPALCPGI